MTPQTLSLRTLNRATLARQLLLERATLPVPQAVARLAGLQAQVQNPPYIGLWTRLQNFERNDLTQAMEAKAVVRATLMRSTIHLFTAEDYLQFRPALQPALNKALNAFFGQRARALTPEPLVAAALALFREQPRTFAQLRAVLVGIAPDQEPEAMAYLIRTQLPLVQVPPGGTWGTGGDIYYALTDGYLGQPLAQGDTLPKLIFRYLAAFGPSSTADVQAWAGLTKLKETLAVLKSRLQVFRDEQGVELYDLPNAPLPDPDTPAPVRFMPEYDNLVLSHADRRRLLPPDHRTKVFLSAARVRATFLLDGMVAGTWKIEKGRGTATLVVEPFAPLAPAAETALGEEGERLVRFVENKAETITIEFRKDYYQ